jgi:hypothetical protein
LLTIVILGDKITKNNIDEVELELVVSNRKSKKEVTTKVMLNYENKNVQLFSKLKFTAYDREVYDGIITLYEAGGKEVEAYKLMRSPILYEYAQISGQIISGPINLLSTKDTVYSTEDVIIIRGYLLRQTEWMKH